MWLMISTDTRCEGGARERPSVLPQAETPRGRTEDELEELARGHQLPADVLAVRQVEPESEGAGGTGDVGVFTPYPLAKGSCIFGPFKVTEVREVKAGRGQSPEQRGEEEEEGKEEPLEDNVLEFTSCGGATRTRVSVQSEGRWLKLIRPGLRPQDTNVTVCLQGGSLVWCEISDDIKSDHELIATCRREAEPAPPCSPRTPPAAPRTPPAAPRTPPAATPPARPPLTPGTPGPVTSAPVTSAPVTPAPCSPAAVSVKSEDAQSGGGTPSPAAMVVKSVLRPTTPNLGRPEPERSPLMQLDRKSSPEHGSSPQPPRYPLIYGCVHCGVKFSNPRTLAAHVEFYCSKKCPPADQSADTNSGDGMEVDRAAHTAEELSYKSRGSVDAALSQMKHEQLSPASGRRSEGDRSSCTSTPKEKLARRLSSEDTSEGPAPKSAKTGHTFQCPFCSYASDKKISLNRHLRMHNSSEESSSRSQTTSPDMEAVDFSSSENFCRECNIQFSSRKTYLGHKEYYCATRRRTHSAANEEGAVAPPAAVSATAVAAHAEAELQQQMASFLPTQAAAYAVQSFLRSPGASQTMNSLLGQHPAIVVAAPMVAPSGMGSISTPTVILQPVIAMPPNMVSPPRASQVTPPNPASQSGPPSAIGNSPPAASPHSEKGDLPLDLSCKREGLSPIRAPSVEPERVRRSPSREPPDPQKDTAEPQDLSVKREFRMPNSECSPQAASPAGREPSMGPRTPEQPPEGVTGIPPPSAELLAAQAQVMSMMSQHAAAAAMMLAPPNISKCRECNIVFYKHENFLIHKEHYCAGRRISKRERMLAKEMSPSGAVPAAHPEQGVRNGSLTPTSESRSPAHCQSLSPRQTTPPVMTPPAAPVSTNKTDIPPMDQSFLQFYCIPCKIKFSSIDTLTAHQEFYCPFNKENQTENGPSRQHRTSPPGAPEPDLPGQGSGQDSGSGSETPETPEGDVYACPHCGHTYPSYRLLKLHFCKAASAHMPLLRCPYCEFITQSDNRLVDHIKGHAPTKAYRCTICGYRGNTVRGMRMHGKTHVDQGQAFSDENMVEYEEPPLIPRRHRTAAVESNPVNMEAELIRLKNEPYKRRRSRKGYEKAENFSPVRRQAPHVCMTCSEPFSDTTKLRQHMRAHMLEATYACRSCDLVTNDKASLVRHVKRVHESSLRSSVDDGNDNNSESADVLSRNTDSIDSTSSVKKETLDVEDIGGSPLNHSDISRSSGAASPDAETEPVVERQNSPPSRSEVREVKAEWSSSQNSPAAIVIKPEKMDSDVNQNRCPSRTDAAQGHVTSPPAAAEAPSDSENINTSKMAAPTPPPPPPAPASILKKQTTSGQLSGSRDSPREAPLRRPTTPLSPINGKGELSAAELLLQKKGDKTGSNYCKQCDITFVYMSSFMAHKQYYCSSHAGERDCAQTEVS